MKIFDVRIDPVTLEEARTALNYPQIIFTPNPEILLEARKNPDFKEALRKGTLMLPDGHGLLLVSHLLTYPKWLRPLLFLPDSLIFLFWKAPFKRVFPQVIHGSDFMRDVVAWSAYKGKSVYFLGGKDGVAEKTAAYFGKKFPKLNIAGFSSLDPSEKAFEAVRKAAPEVLFVAYGAPKQELWIAEYAEKIPSLFHVMGVGGSFDFYSGTVKRAPKWMRSLGLEWVWRLMLNPKQRFKRIWNASVVFPLRTLFREES